MKQQYIQQFIDYKNVMVKDDEPTTKEFICYLAIGVMFIYGFFYFMLAL